MNLLDLPHEILLMIFRQYFASVNVNVLPSSVKTRARKAQSKARQKYLGPMLLSKALKPSAVQVLHINATFHFELTDGRRQPKWREHDRQIQYIAVDVGLVPSLRTALLEHTIRATFPKLKRIAVKDTIYCSSFEGRHRCFAQYDSSTDMPSQSRFRRLRVTQGDL